MSLRSRIKAESLAVAALLTLAVGLGPLATDLYLPSLPAIGGYFGRSVADVQLTLSIFLVGFAFSQLVYGPLSDRFGRRPVMLAGLGIFLAASVLSAFAWSLEVLVVARFLQSLGVCAGPVLGRATVRDIYGPERAAKVLSYMASAMALAPAVAPVIGGVLQELVGWRANFWALGAIALFLLAAIFLVLPETNRFRDATALRPRRLVGNYLTLLGHQSYLGYALIVAFAYCGLFTFISGSSFLLIDVLALSPQVYGLTFGVFVLGYMLGTLVSGRWGQRIGPQRLLGIGALLGFACGATGLALALAGELTVVSVVAPFTVFMVAVGFMAPNAFAGALRYYPHMAGAASSLLGFLQMGMAALVGIGVGHWHDGTALPMAGTLAATSLAGLLAWLLLVRPGAAKDLATRAQPTA